MGLESSKVFNLVQSVTDLPIDVVERYDSKDYIPFGKNNLFPNEVAKLSRESVNHRSIINSKVIFIQGSGVNSDNESLLNFLNENKFEEEVYKRILLDYFITGNSYFEIIINKQKQLLKIFHQDATKIRLSKDKKTVIIHPFWKKYRKDDSKMVGLYPYFTKGDDGLMHSIVHIKDYEPEFQNYGIPNWYAGLNAALIGKKTNEWNKNRLDAGFSIDGMLVVPGVTDTETALKFEDKLESYCSSENAGKVMTHYLQPLQVGEQREEAKFIPFKENADGLFINLHNQSNEDMIKIHSWYKSLCAFTENTGFDTQRIINDYKLARAIIIDSTQKIFTNKLKEIFNNFGYICEEFTIKNVSPISEIIPVKYIWEVRKDYGLEYDENDPKQQIFYAQITSGGKI